MVTVFASPPTVTSEYRPRFNVPVNPEFAKALIIPVVIVEEYTSPPLTIISPSKVAVAFLTLKSPVDAPMLISVATPNAFTIVEIPLKILAVVAPVLPLMVTTLAECCKVKFDPVFVSPVVSATENAPASAVIPPLRVVRPVTVNAPPRVLAPVPTLNVLVPVTEVAPLRETAPVPVPNVPVPD